MASTILPVQEFVRAICVTGLKRLLAVRRGLILLFESPFVHSLSLVFLPSALLIKPSEILTGSQVQTSHPRPLPVLTVLLQVHSQCQALRRAALRGVNWTLSVTAQIAWK